MSKLLAALGLGGLLAGATVIAGPQALQSIASLTGADRSAVVTTETSDEKSSTTSASTKGGGSTAVQLGSRKLGNSKTSRDGTVGIESEASQENDSSKAELKKDNLQDKAADPEGSKKADGKTESDAPIQNESAESADGQANTKVDGTEPNTGALKKAGEEQEGEEKNIQQEKSVFESADAVGQESKRESRSDQSGGDPGEDSRNDKTPESIVNGSGEEANAKVDDPGKINIPESENKKNRFVHEGSQQSQLHRNQNDPNCQQCEVCDPSEFDSAMEHALPITAADFSLPWEVSECNPGIGLLGIKRFDGSGQFYRPGVYIELMYVHGVAPSSGCRLCKHNQTTAVVAARQTIYVKVAPGWMMAKQTVQSGGNPSIRYFQMRQIQEDYNAAHAMTMGLNSGGTSVPSTLPSPATKSDPDVKSVIEVDDPEVPTEKETTSSPVAKNSDSDSDQKKLRGETKNQKKRVGDTN